MKISKTCRYDKCKKTFIPYNSMQPYCSWKCKNADEKEKKQDLADKVRVQLISIPENVTREWFESIPKHADRKKIAKRLEEKARRKLMIRALRNGGKDAAGEIVSDIHHCWPKLMGGSTPLWYSFQEMNMLPIGRKTHRAIHDKAYEDLTEKQKIVYQIAKAKRIKSEKDHEIYQESQKVLF